MSYYAQRYSAWDKMKSLKVAAFSEQITQAQVIKSSFLCGVHVICSQFKYFYLGI